MNGLIIDFNEYNVNKSVVGFRENVFKEKAIVYLEILRDVNFGVFAGITFKCIYGSGKIASKFIPHQIFVPHDIQSLGLNIAMFWQTLLRML